MTRFRFEAIDPRGKARRGTLDAPDQAAAEAVLRGRGLAPTALGPAVARPAPTPTLSERDVAALLEQLHGLTAAGLPLPGGLRAAGAELDSAPLRGTFARLADHLDGGRGLDEALAAEAGPFPAHLRGLVRAGARTGRLADVLAEIIRGSNLGHELRRRIAATIAYPAAVLAIVLALNSVLCHAWRQVAADLDVGRDISLTWDLPVPAVHAVAGLVADYDGWVALGLAIAGGMGAWAWRYATPPARRRRFLESIPLYGPLLQFVALAEFCHLAALLVEAETPLPEAIRLAGGSVRDAALAETVEQVAAGVSGGQPLAAALRSWPGLPAGLGQLLAWGEGQQELAGALRFGGDLFEARAEAQAAFTGQVVGAGLSLAILWWVGFAVAAIYLPITTAIELWTRLIG